MITYSRLVKKVVPNGNSLAVNISQEAKRMGLTAGDEVLVSLERADGVECNQFRGAGALIQLMEGRVLRCEEQNARIAMGPMNRGADGLPRETEVMVAPIEAMDRFPKDAWLPGTLGLGPLSRSLMICNWVLDDADIEQINLNTKAYRAICRDAQTCFMKRGARHFPSDEELQAEIIRLNDAGWDYDAENDKGIMPDAEE